MSTERIIELTFKVVMILASLGIVITLIKRTWNKVRTVIVGILTINSRVTALENKFKRKTKTKTKNKKP